MNEIKLDKEYIVGLISNILKVSHSDPQKRKIVPHNDRLNFSCPICGDSQKHAFKKRGNLYFKNMRYICYNDESCSMTFTSLLNRFNIQMDIDKKLELYDYLDNNTNYVAVNNDETIKLDKLIPIDTLCEFFKSDYTRGLTNLRPLQKNSAVYDYIVNERKISNTTDIYEGVYHITETWKQPVVVFLNRNGNNVISFQIRNLLKVPKRFFNIYYFTIIYDMMYPENEMDEQERRFYDKLSHFYNIFNINMNNTIHVFEGYIDSLTIPNSVGLIGLNTDVSFLLKEELNLKFVYDNDLAGFKKATKSLKEKQYVFLWNKFFIDMVKTYKGSKNKYELADELSDKVKDFNKLSTYFKKPLYQMFDLNKYFSNDDIDEYYLMPLYDLIRMEI
jgi:hypothetical protein